MLTWVSVLTSNSGYCSAKSCSTRARDMGRLGLHGVVMALEVPLRNAYQSSCFATREVEYQNPLGAPSMGAHATLPIASQIVLEVPLLAQEVVNHDLVLNTHSAPLVRAHSGADLGASRGHTIACRFALLFGNEPSS